MNVTKVLKDHLPWVAPSVAIVLAATGFFDRSGNEAPQPAPATATVAAAPQPAPAPVVAPAPAAAPIVAAAPVTAPAPAPVAPVTQPAAVEVTRAELVAPSIAGLANPNAQQGTAGDRQSVVTLQNGFTQTAAAAPQVAPQSAVPQQAPLSGASAASFFAAAQANLAAQNSCKSDLRALVSQARVYFPSGGLTADAGGLEQARLIGTVAQNCPGVRIQVEGHSDASGNPTVNQRLSLQRAEKVIQRIAASGIEEGLFTAKGFGSSFPSGITGPQSAAFYDRRVEFSVIETVTPVAFNATPNFGAVSSCVAELQAAVLREQLFFSPRSIAVQPAQMDSAYQLATKAAGYCNLMSGNLSEVCA